MKESIIYKNITKENLLELKELSELKEILNEIEEAT